MKVSVIVTMIFEQEIGTKTNDKAKDWLQEDIKTALESWENGYEHIDFPSFQILRSE